MTSSQIDRDETVGIEVSSSPTGRLVKVSVTGAGGGTTEVRGTTPFTTEVRVHVECARGDRFCILGTVSFEPLVNDPSTGTLTLCMSALGRRQCQTGTIIVLVNFGG